MPSTSHGWSASARYHVRTPFTLMFRLLLLGNGWADYVEIYYALGDPLVTAYAVVTGGVSMHVRTGTLRFCTYLRNGSADYDQIWCVGLESLPKCFTQVISWVLLHVRTCTRYLRISRTDRPIVLKFYVGLEMRPNNVKVCKRRRWSDCTYARASPVSLPWKPLRPVPEVSIKNRFMSFALARSSPNMASCWF